MATATQLDKLYRAWTDLQRAVNVTLPSLKKRANAVYLHSLDSGGNQKGK